MSNKAITISLPVELVSWLDVLGKEQRENRTHVLTRIIENARTSHWQDAHCNVVDGSQASGFSPYCTVHKCGDYECPTGDAS